MMKELTGSLGVAFYTTLLALLLSAVLMATLHLVQGREETALNRVGPVLSEEPRQPSLRGAELTVDARPPRRRERRRRCPKPGRAASGRLIAGGTTMKRKSREINIFSMSALDLFASALGAFILIAIVIFPYFPNTSPRVMVPCPPVPAPPAPAPPVPCPPVPAAPVPAPPVPAPPVPAPPVFSSSATQFPHLDLVIALDVTGSMRGHIDGLKAEVDQLSRLLTELTPSLGLGVVAFGDRAWERPIATFDLREISGSPASQAALRDFVLALSPNMGQGRGSNRDNPEAFHTALEVAAGMGWRPSRRAALHRADYRQPGVSRGRGRSHRNGRVVCRHARRQSDLDRILQAQEQRASHGGVSPEGGAGRGGARSCWTPAGRSR